MEDCCLFRNLTVVQNFILLQIGRHFTTVEESDYPVMQSFTLVNQFRPGCSFCSLEGSITYCNKVDDIVGYISSLGKSLLWNTGLHDLHHFIVPVCSGQIGILGLPNFRDGTGRFRKMRVPNFRDAGTVTETPTCLKSGIKENLACLKSGITEILTFLCPG